MHAQIRTYQQPGYHSGGKRNQKQREALILQYAPLVKTLAERMAIRLPAHISEDELTSAGIVGLMDALDKFDEGKGIKFQTYARYRIRGAMLDELRKMDWIPRSVRDDIQNIEKAMANLRTRLGREPEDAEIAKEMGVDLEYYYQKLKKVGGVNLLSLDEISQDGITPRYDTRSNEKRSPWDDLKIKETKQVIAKAIMALTQKEQTVMALYYYEELTLKEIAHVLSLTESRISQIHSKAIIRLRTKLKTYYDA